MENPDWRVRSSFSLAGVQDFLSIFLFSIFSFSSPRASLNGIPPKRPIMLDQKQTPNRVRT